MILFNDLTIRKVLAFTEADLNKENTKTLQRLRKWCGEQMDKMNKVIDVSDESETKDKLIEQRKELNNVRIRIDKINGVSTTKIASRNTSFTKMW